MIVIKKYFLQGVIYFNNKYQDKAPEMKIALYKRYIFAFVVLTFITPCFIDCFAQSGWKDFRLSGFAQGTTYHITYYAKEGIVTKRHMDSILDNIDSSLSIYKPYSLISRFNNTDAGIELDNHLHTVVLRSLEIFKETGGISDITIYPVVQIWNFGPEPNPGQPDSAEILAILPCVGSGKIHITGNRLVKDIPCVKIDVNGIGQGYSVDVIADFLEKNDIQNYLVEVGGEIRIKGLKKTTGQFMQVGIESPAQNSFDEPIIKKVIQPDHGAITTSGNFRKYYIKQGKTISHLMNPKTGYPIQNELISVTVWAKDAITADGYDNALMGMGLEKALLFMKQHTDMEAYFIYRKATGAVSDTATSGFYKFIK